MTDISHATLPEIAKPDRRQRVRAPFRKARRERERVQLLGQMVDLVRPEEVLHHVETWVRARRKVLIANHNVNSMALMQRNPRLQRFYARADLIEVDSAPLIKFAKLLGLHGQAFHRCTYLDWRDHFWSLVDRNGWRVMYIGGEPKVVERARGRLASEYPNADIRVRDGFFVATPGSRDNTVVVNEVKAFNPHILFVGMGMPRQELWILDNIDALPDCAIFSVGAAFDYEAGEQRAAPRWMGRMGIEWLFRLASDPKRLARRYLIEPWILSPLIAADLWAAFKARRGGGTAVSPSPARKS